MEASHHVASHGSEVTKRLIVYGTDSIIKLGKTRPDWDGKVRPCVNETPMYAQQHWISRPV